MSTENYRKHINLIIFINIYNLFRVLFVLYSLTNLTQPKLFWKLDIKYSLSNGIRRNLKDFNFKISQILFVTLNLQQRIFKISQTNVYNTELATISLQDKRKYC